MMNLGTNTSFGRIFVAKPILTATINDTTLFTFQKVSGPGVIDQTHPALIFGTSHFRDDNLLLTTIETVLAVVDLIIKLVLKFTIDWRIVRNPVTFVVH